MRFIFLCLALAYGGDNYELFPHTQSIPIAPLDLAITLGEEDGLIAMMTLDEPKLSFF
jgi:hypothetical protein